MADMTTERLDELRTLAVQYGKHYGYEVAGRLGFGGSAAVFHLRNESAEMALKVYDPTFFEGEGGPSERRRIELQKKLIGHKCHSLVGIQRIEYSADTCFIEMPFAPWKDLSKEIGNVPRPKIYQLLEELVAAVRYLEAEGLVHRDIKPANILISPDYEHLILIDLGVVREWTADEDRADGTDHGRRRPFIATNQYSSPEYLFRTQAPSEELWKALTLYQIGGVLHDLIVRKPLFQEQVETGNRYAVALAVQQATPNLDSATDVPAHLKGLTLRCLTKDPAKRLKLVNWDDFAPPSADPAQLAKRLSSIGVTQDRQHAVQQEKLQLAVQRAQASTELVGRLEAAMKDNFPDALLEVVHPPDRRTQHMLRWHFPPLAWAMDVSINVTWPEDDGIGNQPGIRLHALLTRTDRKPEFVDGEIACTWAAEGQNVDTVVACLFDAVCKRLADALVHLEQGEPQKPIALGS